MIRTLLSKCGECGVEAVGERHSSVAGATGSVGRVRRIRAHDASVRRAFVVEEQMPRKGLEPPPSCED